MLSFNNAKAKGPLISGYLSLDARKQIQSPVLLVSRIDVSWYFTLTLGHITQAHFTPV